MPPDHMMLSTAWHNIAEFGQSPVGILFFVVLPVGLTLVTTFIYLAERELKKHPSQIIILSMVAYAMAWLALAVMQVSAYFCSQWQAVPLAISAFSLVLVALPLTYLAVVIVFECAPRAALRFWCRWIVLIIVFLLLLVFASLGVGT